MVVEKTTTRFVRQTWSSEIIVMIGYIVIMKNVFFDFYETLFR